MIYTTCTRLRPYFDLKLGQYHDLTEINNGSMSSLGKQKKINCNKLKKTRKLREAKKHHNNTEEK